MNIKEIEVIDQHFQRHRFSDTGIYYAWRPKAGTFDQDDFKILDIFQELESGDVDLIASFPNVSRVGFVTDDTALCMPLTELRQEICPRCGYKNTPGKGVN